MKKLFITLFFVSLFCPIIANDLIDKEVISEIGEIVSEGVIDVKEEKDSSSGASEKSVARIVFTQTVNAEMTTYDRPLVNKYKDCVAVIIDDAWAIASKKCKLAPGDKTYVAGEVIDVSVSDFKIEFNKKLYKADNVVELTNVFLLKITNENGNPLMVNTPKARLFFVPVNKVNSRWFADILGEYKVNRTDRNTPAYDAAHDKIQDNFQPYKTGRTLYTKGIKDFYVKGNNVTVTLDWIKQVRAGDPLFYLANGKEYLLGFGKAVNLDDRKEEARSYEVSLLTDLDKNEILNNISAIDKKAAKRIEENIKK